MSLKNKQPHGQGGAGVLIEISNSVNISENNSHQWKKFQMAVFAYQQNHTLENLVIAQAAHKVWAVEFLGMGGQNV